ncbi:MAG: hypothetical protein U1F08_01785 [Steroidobacteraceae bacterium]
MPRHPAPPARRRPRTFAVLALGLLAALSGCSTIQGLFPPDRKEQKQAARLLQLQQRNMRFADMYVGSLIASTHQLEFDTSDTMQRYRISGWLLAQANAAYVYASEDNAIAGTLDLITLATISRMVVEDAGRSRFSEHADELLAVQSSLEPQAWALADGVLNAEQQADLKRLLADWRAKHPDAINAPFVRFQEFAGVGNSGPPHKGKLTLPSSLIGLVGLDPMAGLDPAVRQVEQTRLLAERGLYYAQRVPVIMDLQLDRSVNRLAAGPESQKLQADASSLTDSAARFTKVAESLPATLANERKALIEQLNMTLVAQAATLRPLLADLRGTLEAGSEAAKQVDAATRSLDALVARFERKPGEPPGRPFDVTEYGKAANEIGHAASELRLLLDATGTSAPKLGLALGAGATEGRALVDYFFVRVAWLIVLLCVGLLATLLIYRRLAAPGRTT